MEILFWILVEVLLWIAIFILWILFLPVALLIATPIILVISAIRKDPPKCRFVRFIEWWTDVIPSLPDFKKKRKPIETK